MATLYLTPFGKNDPKLSYALESVEPRIHFALNCGAKSCPPIKTFTTEHVENELATATESYLENDDAIMIEAEKNIVFWERLTLKTMSSKSSDNVTIIV